jgi:hypothetical protein
VAKNENHHAFIHLFSEFIPHIFESDQTLALQIAPAQLIWEYFCFMRRLGKEARRTFD